MDVESKRGQVRMMRSYYTINLMARPVIIYAE
jgi:hypothetical protein